MFQIQWIFLKRISVILLLAAAAVLTGAQKEPAKLEPTKHMSTITQATTLLLTNRHFLQQKIDESLSEQLFLDYFKTLDPSHIFFTRQDLAAFDSVKTDLGNQLRRGNIQFAFDVFKLFLTRLDDYEKFTTAYLKSKPSLNSDDTYEFNRTKSPWPADRKELEILWKKKIRNDLILLEMLDRSQKELKAEEKKKKAAEPAKPQSPAKADAKTEVKSGAKTDAKTEVKSGAKTDAAASEKKGTAAPKKTSSFRKFINTLLNHETGSQEKNAGKNAPVKRIVRRPVDKTPLERTRYRISRFLQFYRNMDAMDILELYLSTLTQIYDPHSQYMSPRSEEDFNINMKLSLVGIGALLSSEDGYTKIVKIIPGGPADLDGRLKAEDRIIAVTQENEDPVDILDMPLNKVVNMIRGKEKTKVTLTILQGSKGSSAAPVNITLTRDKVRLKESEASGKLHEIRTRTGKKRVAVLTLPSFYIDFSAAYRGDPNYRSSTRDIANLIMKFSKDAPLDGLVIDLRSNGGGSLLEAVTMTGLFIKEGPVVQVRDQRSCKVDEDKDGGRILYSGPLALLTNRFSASASEIFAGAIKDYQRGIILGDSKTHGKGTVQTLEELDKLTAFWGNRKPAGTLKLTNAKFYRINGESTQLKGITPDIVFPSFTDAMEIGEDKLDHAMKWDTIEPVAFQYHNPRLSFLIPILRERSKIRVDNSRDFQLLKRDIDIYRKLRDRKTVVLNLEKRWKEYLAEKKLEDEQQKLLRLEKDEDRKAKNDVKDLYLDETLNVIKDWIELEKRGVLAQKSNME